MKLNFLARMAAVAFGMTTFMLQASSPGFHTITLPVEINLTQAQINIIKADHRYVPNYTIRAGSEDLPLFQFSRINQPLVPGTYRLVNAAAPVHDSFIQAPTSIWIVTGKNTPWQDDPGGSIQAAYTLGDSVVGTEIYLPHNFDFSQMIFGQSFEKLDNGLFFCNVYVNGDPGNIDPNRCAIFWMGDYNPYQ